MPKAAHKVVVIGHRNPDTDSICSAIAYAELKNKTSDLVCEARRAGKMNQETEFVLKKFGVKPPRMCTDVNPKIRDVDYREMPGIPGTTSLRKAWEIMRDKQIDTLPITDADNELLGLITVDAYVVIVMFIIFKIIDKTIGLRVPAEVEIDGLDIHEHGLASAYAGFSISDANAAAMVPNENTDLGEDDVTRATDKQISAAVPVVREASPVIHDGVYDTGMHKVSIIAKLSKFDQLKTALNDLGVTGMTVTQVMGCGIQKGTSEKYRGVPVDSTLLPKIKVEVIVSRISVDAVVEAAKKALYTGHIGDGKIFVYNVTRVVKIRTGEEDFAALQDVE